MIKTGIHTCYNGELGEIRRSNFFNINKAFEKKTTLSFKYVLSGEENYIVDGQEISLKRGNALFFKDDKSYHGIIDSVDVTTGLCIDLNFDKTIISKDILQEDLLFLFDPEFKTQKVNFLSPQLHKTLLKIGTEQNQDILFLEESMCEFMHGVLGLEAEFQSKIAAIPVKKKNYQQELFKRLLIARNFIHDNLQQHIQLNDIAEASNVSAFYIHRLFRQVFGCSPTVYLEQIRMEAAKEKLRLQYAVKEVAYAVGYTDEAYFCRRFKKCFGMTPKHFMKTK
jgi:AraC-like DNA-binding protein